MYFWSMAYKIFYLLSNEAMSFSELLQAIQEVLLFKQEFHFYYIHIILLVYIFLPVTRAFVKNSDKKQIQYFLAIWFCLGILYPTVISFWPFTLISGIPKTYMLNMAYAAIGYGVLGYYLRNFNTLGSLRYFFIFGIGWAFVFSGTWYWSIINGTLYTGFLEGMSVAVCLMAIGIFGFFSSGRKITHEKTRRIITFFSKAAFCIYLVHIFFLKTLPSIGLSFHTFPALISTPVLTITSFALSCGVFVVLSRIPVVKKWLV
jgi:surface polysaccharide O-acyltransferase-like enzyme